MTKREFDSFKAALGGLQHVDAKRLYKVCKDKLTPKQVTTIDALLADVPVVKATKPVSKAVSPGKATPKAARSHGATTFTVVLGTYGTTIKAQQDAHDYMHPNVFFYRSAIFPNPTNFGVVVVVNSATVVALDTNNPLYPYGVELSIDVSGDPDSARSWIKAFQDRARPMKFL